MSVPAYPCYRNSEADWVGTVPSHWQDRRIGALFTERRDKVSDRDFPPLSVTKNGVVPQLETAAKTDDNDNRKCVRKGDFVINSRSDRKGSSGVSDLDGSVSLINTVLSPRTELFAPFVHHLLRSAAFQEEFYRYGKGIVADLWSTNYSEMKAIKLAVPSLPEQQAIAAFLDRETAKIDALMEEQQRLIALLDEKRQAVVSHAVTKGLNPGVPMKDSGIERLGEVPAHWSILPLKSVGYFSAGAGFPDSEQGVEDEELPFHKVNALGKAGADGTIGGSENTISRETAQRLRAHVFPSGAIVFAKIGAALLLGRVRQLSRPACLDNNMMGLVVNESNSSDFVRHLMTLVRFDYISNPGTVPSLNEGHIANVRFAFPPVGEQREIANVLSERLNKLDALSREAGAAVGLLRERRSALISAAVTGKIDVSGSAEVLAFPIDRARARGLVATEIIERSARQATFGRVKLQKIAFLAEAHVGISELSGGYIREAAGPLDRVMIEEMESGARTIASITIDQSGGAGTAVAYLLAQHQGAHRGELLQWLGADRSAKLDKLITDFRDLNTHAAEAVATLYAVWNDKLIEGASPTDDEIITGFLNDWHPEKREKFRASELPEWLGWMRRHGLVPTGSGPKTTTGRLFA